MSPTTFAIARRLTWRRITQAGLASPGGAALFALLGLVALASTGCENLAIGRTCTTLADDEVTDLESIFNDEALECPTRLCVKPARQAVTSTDTAPFCTAECNADKDCADHEKRDPKNPRDKRCTKGFTCAIAFETQPFACQKMCLCKDFVGDNPEVPLSCRTP